MCVASADSGEEEKEGITERRFAAGLRREFLLSDTEPPAPICALLPLALWLTHYSLLVVVVFQGLR